MVYKQNLSTKVDSSLIEVMTSSIIVLFHGCHQHQTDHDFDIHIFTRSKPSPYSSGNVFLIQETFSIMNHPMMDNSREQKFQSQSSRTKPDSAWVVPRKRSLTFLSRAPNKTEDRTETVDQENLQSSKRVALDTLGCTAFTLYASIASVALSCANICSRLDSRKIFMSFPREPCGTCEIICLVPHSPIHLNTHY